MSMESPRIVGVSRKFLPATWQETLEVSARRSPDIFHVRERESWRTHLFNREELNRLPSGLFVSKQQAIDYVDEAISTFPADDDKVYPFDVEVNHNWYVIVNLFRADNVVAQRNAVAEKFIELADIDIREVLEDGEEWEASMVIGRSYGCHSQPAVKNHIMTALPGVMQLDQVGTNVLDESEIG